MTFQARDFLTNTTEQNWAFIDRCCALGYCTRPANPYPVLGKKPGHTHTFREDGRCYVYTCKVTRDQMLAMNQEIADSPILQEQARLTQPVALPDPAQDAETGNDAGQSDEVNERDDYRD